MLSRSQFEKKLEQLAYIPKTWAKETLKVTLDQLYADYYKSGKSFDLDDVLTDMVLEESVNL